MIQPMMAQSPFYRQFQEIQTLERNAESQGHQALCGILHWNPAMFHSLEPWSACEELINPRTEPGYPFSFEEWYTAQETDALKRNQKDKNAHLRSHEVFLEDLYAGLTSRSPQPIYEDRPNAVAISNSSTLEITVEYAAPSLQATIRKHQRALAAVAQNAAALFAYREHRDLVKLCYILENHANTKRTYEKEQRRRLGEELQDVKQELAFDVHSSEFHTLSREIKLQRKANQAVRNVFKALPSKHGRCVKGEGKCELMFDGCVETSVGDEICRFGGSSVSFAK